MEGQYHPCWANLRSLKSLSAQQDTRALLRVNRKRLSFPLGGPSRPELIIKCGASSSLCCPCCPGQKSIHQSASLYHFLQKPKVPVTPSLSCQKVGDDDMTLAPREYRIAHRVPICMAQLRSWSVTFPDPSILTLHPFAEHNRLLF